MFANYAENPKQVWDEMMASEAINGSILPDAEAIVQEAMQRVSRNLDIVLFRLKQIGFQFGLLGPSVDSESEWLETEGLGLSPVRTMPDLMVSQRIGKLESAYGGFLPLSLREFWEKVGGVNLVGFHPEWPIAVDELDPLFITPLTDANLNFLLTTHQPPGWILLSPDRYTKAEISGGAPYHMTFSKRRAIDSIFIDEWLHLMFVDYLRLAFQWGGFTGLGRYKIPKAHIEFLTDGLEAF